MKRKTKNPIIVDIKTRIDFCLDFIRSVIPVMKERMAEKTAIRNGIVNFRLLKKVSPPLSPSWINVKNIVRDIMNDRIKIKDSLPKVVFGRMVGFILGFCLGCSYFSIRNFMFVSVRFKKYSVV